MIHIIGLGPGDPGLITRRAWELITQASEIWVRTREHPAIPEIARHATVHSYDHLYETHNDFDAVYAAIAEDVVARAAEQDVVYAVPGDPAVAERTPALIRQRAHPQGISVTIHAAVSFLEPTFAALDADPIHGVQILDAQRLAQMHHPPGSLGMGLIIPQLYNRLLAGDVKLTLMNAYPDDHQVTLISGAGTDALRLQALPLYELDRRDDLDDMTTLWVPPLDRPATYEDLQEIIAHLRAPDGCPWDRKQTHQTLRPYLLEETYEVLDALDAEDSQALKEELGDLLIQIALHVQIATEEGEFKLADVIAHVVDKLIRRHPHVFGDVNVTDAEEVARNWEAIKQREREENGQQAKKQTLLDGIPAALPALARAQTYASRLARVGYPLPEPAGWTEEELGWALMRLAEQAEASGLDAEAALRSVTRRLREMLITLEEAARRQGDDFLRLPDEEKRRRWKSIIRKS
ncbi:MAG TPA: MazG family protein [Anaerolineae bacterium]|nr:MazG family protein [Anaerolineae bacterium]